VLKNAFVSFLTEAGPQHQEARGRMQSAQVRGKRPYSRFRHTWWRFGWLTLSR